VARAHKGRPLPPPSPPPTQLVGNSIYYGYTLSNNGKAEQHGSNYAADYLPDLVLNKTLDFIDSVLSSPSPPPFFAYLSPPSCHGPQDAAPQYQGLFPGQGAPRTPAFGAKVDDTHWIQEDQAVYGLDANSAAFADLVFRRRVQTLQSVDDMIEAVVKKLSDAGVLDNTYIMYSTDNGCECGRGGGEKGWRPTCAPTFPPALALTSLPPTLPADHLGHYGLIYDKRQPWETDVHLPFFMRGPGIALNSTSDVLVSMPDLAATVLDIAGVPIPSHFDGISVLPYVVASPAAGSVSGGGAPRAPPTPRQMTLVEYHGEVADGGGSDPACSKTRGTNLFCNPDGNYTIPPFFYGEPLCVCQDAANNTYACLRVHNASADFRYCEFADAVGTVEYFDYVTDPYELTNLAPTMAAPLKDALSAKLAAATHCVGTAACEAVLTSFIEPAAGGARAAAAA
jgi:N-acetylglucosamine-6-sulfatase